MKSTNHKNHVKLAAMHAPDVLNEAYPACAYSRGIRCQIGDATMLFASGTASINQRGASVHSGDFKAQARRMYANLTGLLQSEGATWHDVVKVLVFLADMRYYREFNEVRTAFFKQQGLKRLPASSCIEARLCRPDLMIEAELIAVLATPKAKASGKRMP